MLCTGPYKFAGDADGRVERKGERRGSQLEECEPQTLPKSDEGAQTETRLKRECER